MPGVEALLAQVRAGVDQDALALRLDVDRAAAAPVARVGRAADGAVAADLRHARGGAAAQDGHAHGGDLGEQAVEVGRRGGLDLGHRQAADLGQRLGDVRGVGGLVGPAAHRHGREVGGVGLQQQAVERHVAHDRAQLVGLRKVRMPPMPR